MSLSEQALAAFQEGAVNQGQELLEKALRKDSADDLYQLAQELQQLGLSVPAKQLYQFLLAQFPQEDILRVNLAEILISDGQIDSATDLLARVAPDSDAYVASLLVGADLYQTLGLYEVSEQKLLQALKLAPQEQVIQFAMAELYFNENKFAAAIDFYEQLLDQEITEFSGISVYQRLAAAQAGLGNYEAAIDNYSKTRAEFLNADSLYNYASLELEVKNYTKAQELIQQLLKLAPDYSSAYILQTRLYLAQNQPNKAYQAAQQGLSYDPYNELLYELGANAAQKLGQSDAAIALLKQGVKQMDAPNSLILALSQLYLTEEDYQENVDLLTQYQDQLQDDAQPQWNLGRSFAALEQSQKALEALLGVYETFKNNSAYLQDLILLLRQGDQPDLLKAAVQNYLQLDPDNLEMNDLWRELNSDYDN
ncbi:tetratricopeptide repeat protein [Bombilactobacillus folatiphilus]|uniref:Tetratricopeptide repeat protein n=1 Tax=Bombilactobacillus folatiphilus TaxID=2923362 RepID=A0ABY4PB00_9LACO|nr:tetratricopeptide repeat protein [Bombilactobacillus folatiphilus]UQS82777.1 tetratricopeptide repeat protein [Bombilactobacillus folatiphilus]